MKILFVDSAKNHYETFMKIFEHDKESSAAPMYDFEFFTAENTPSALALYQESHPDLVMINMDLGADMSKLLCETIRKMEGTRHTGIILLGLNSTSSDSTPIECLEIGADDVIRMGCPMREIRARTNAVLRLKAMTDELRSANHKLHQLSLTDELTGLDNMRAFNAKYSRAINDCRQGTSGLGIIMIDLDNFKMVNDKTNHLMGSHVIAEVGKLIRSSQIFDLEKDCTARFGGDEYIFFTKDESFAALEKKAEELKKIIRNGIFVKDGFSIRITTSVGFCWVKPGFAFDKAEDPIKAADMMLYKSKKQGRDRVSSIILEEGVDIDQVANDLNDSENPFTKPDYAKIYQM